MNSKHYIQEQNQPEQPGSIDQAIKLISKAPSMGTKSAHRLVYSLLKNQENLTKLIYLLEELKNTIKTCEICGNLDEGSTCRICLNESRDPSTICVVEEIDDLLTIEKSGNYKGLYHVLWGRISPMDGIMPANLNITTLLSRLSNQSITEIIFANSAKIESQTTMFYIMESIQETYNTNQITTLPIFSQLANGIPLGSNLDYLDEGTIRLAFQARKKI